MPGGAIENGRWLGGGAEGRRERLLHRAAHRHRRSVPLARDAHKTAITAQHSMHPPRLLVRRRRPITHLELEGPAAAAMSTGWDWDVLETRRRQRQWLIGERWARECGGEMIVIGPRIYTSGWTSGVDRCRRCLLNCGGTPLVRTFALFVWLIRHG